MDLEKMTEIEGLCETIILSLFEIKNHICNERYFEGGVDLGCLITSLGERQAFEERTRRRPVDVNENWNEDWEEKWEDEEEDEDEEIQEYKEFKAQYETRLKENEETINFYEKKNTLLQTRISEFSILIKNLISKDHIFVASLDQAIRVAKEPWELDEDYYKLLPKKD